jgi:hypothetical protein
VGGSDIVSTNQRARKGAYAKTADENGSLLQKA